MASTPFIRLAGNTKRCRQRKMMKKIGYSVDMTAEQALMAFGN